MHIQSDDIIAGQPVLKIRKLLKYGDGNIDTIVDVLNTGYTTANQVYQVLCDEEYIEPSEDFGKDTQYWHNTVKGNVLANASARKPIKRRNAEELIKKFLERVKAINDCDDYVYYIKQVIVFGSYLSDKPTLSDVDIAVTIEFRYDDESKRHEQSEKRIQHAIEQGRNFKNAVEHYGWPQIEIFRILKAHSPSISLHDAKSEQLFFQSVPSKVLFETTINEINRNS